MLHSYKLNIYIIFYYDIFYYRYDLLNYFIISVDSGHSTLRDPIECDSDHKSLQEEFCNLSDTDFLRPASEIKYSYLYNFTFVNCECMINLRAM